MTDTTKEYVNWGYIDTLDLDSATESYDNVVQLHDFDASEDINTHISNHFNGIIDNIESQYVGI
jgi:hypothetical protein